MIKGIDFLGDLRDILCTSDFLRNAKYCLDPRPSQGS